MKLTGIAIGYEAVAMLMTAANVVPTHTFNIERVADPTRLACAADRVASAFGLDRAWVGDTLAAPSLLNAPAVHYFLATKTANHIAQ